MTTVVEGLSGLEQRALEVATGVYEAVRRSDVLDAPQHWDRFAARLRSAAYAQTAPAFLEQVARRFGVPHTPHEALSGLLHMPGEEARRVLRIIRQDSNALSVLVRDNRAKEREV